jgi:hypothetical protein
LKIMSPIAKANRPTAKRYQGSRRAGLFRSVPATTAAAADTPIPS